MVQGATLKFYDSHADVLLLSVPNVIPDHFKVRSRSADPHAEAWHLMCCAALTNSHHDAPAEREVYSSVTSECWRTCASSMTGLHGLQAYNMTRS